VRLKCYNLSRLTAVSVFSLSITHDICRRTVPVPLQLGDADASDVAARLEDFLSICAPPESVEDFKVGTCVCCCS
jgi:hypothetical protein